MVNVGGRSKGCSTCRRRRIKCDEHRPVCRRCQKTGLQCEGVRDITFVEGKIVKSRRTESRAVLSSRSTVQDADCVVPPSLPLKGLEFDICLCYTRKHLRRGGLVDSALDSLPRVDIRSGISAMANAQVADQAILGFSIILFGTQHGLPAITSPGYAIYAMALKQLNHALSDPIRSKSDEVIRAVATFVITECFVPSGPKSYTKHGLGLDCLMRMRDPSLPCSPSTFKIYRAIRHMILLAAVQARRPSVLAHPGWKRVFRANCSALEMQEQEIYDILADCTVLASRRDRMTATLRLHPETRTDDREQLAFQALSLLAQLGAWREEWGRDKENFYFESSAYFTKLQPMPDPLGKDALPFTTAFEFVKKSAVIPLMFYNMALIHVLQILESLTLEGLQDVNPMQDLLTRNTLADRKYPDHALRADYFAMEQAAVLEVCRCFPYYLHEVSRSDSSQFPIARWVVMTAWRSLHCDETAEGRWLWHLLSETSQVVPRL